MVIENVCLDCVDVVHDTKWMLYVDNGVCRCTSVHYELHKQVYSMWRLNVNWFLRLTLWTQYEPRGGFKHVQHVQPNRGSPQARACRTAARHFLAYNSESRLPNQVLAAKLRIQLQREFTKSSRTLTSENLWGRAPHFTDHGCRGLNPPVYEPLGRARSAGDGRWRWRVDRRTGAVKRRLRRGDCDQPRRQMNADGVDERQKAAETRRPVTDLLQRVHRIARQLHTGTTTPIGRLLQTYIIMPR